MNDPSIQSGLLQAAQAVMPDDALQAVRQSALAEFEREGLPAARAEDWKYTNLSPATELNNIWLQQAVDEGAFATLPEVAEASLPDIDAHWLVLRDGIVDESSLASLASLAGEGVRISRLGARPESIRVDGPFDRLNASLLRDGVHIEVSPGARLAKPLAILFDDGDTAVSQARVVLDVGRDAAIDMVEFHRSRGTREHFANTVTQVGLAPASHAGLVRIQDRDRAHYQVGKLSARLASDARLDYASFDFGGRLVRQDVFADLAEAGSAVHLNGLYLADGKQHIDNHTRVDHRVGPAVSRELFRGILNGSARCVFNGKAIVHAGADGSDAEQSNHNLLLSEKAEVDTKPELEIYADDVKCSHGATVGQLDRQALYYMRTRGLDSDEARHMLTRAFAGQILSKLPFDGVRESLEARIDARLDALLAEESP